MSQSNLKPAKLDLAIHIGTAMARADITGDEKRFATLARIYQNLLPEQKARADMARGWMIAAA